MTFVHLKLHKDSVTLSLSDTITWNPPKMSISAINLQTFYNFYKPSCTAKLQLLKSQLWPTEYSLKRLHVGKLENLRKIKELIGFQILFTSWWLYLASQDRESQQIIQTVVLLLTFGWSVYDLCSFQYALIGPCYLLDTLHLLLDALKVLVDLIWG